MNSIIEIFKKGLDKLFIKAKYLNKLCLIKILMNYVWIVWGIYEDVSNM